jgi:uncharacterized protein YeaO (DUF488 family)
MSRRSRRLGVKRVYEPPEASDGTRVLVDRIWPRAHGSMPGRRVAEGHRPSRRLRAWFGHDPNRWYEFHKRYLRSSAPITPQSST